MIQRMVARYMCALICGAGLAACINQTAEAQCNDAEWTVQRAYNDCMSKTTVYFNCPKFRSETDCDYSAYFACLAESVSCDGEAPDAIQEADAPCKKPEGCKGISTGSDGGDPGATSEDSATSDGGGTSDTG